MPGKEIIGPIAQTGGQLYGHHLQNQMERDRMYLEQGMQPPENNHGCLKAMGIGAAALVGVTGLAFWQARSTVDGIMGSVNGFLHPNSQVHNTTVIEEVVAEDLTCTTAATWYNEASATTAGNGPASEIKTDAKRTGFTSICFDDKQAKTTLKKEQQTGKVINVKAPGMLVITHVDPIPQSALESDEEMDKYIHHEASLLGRVSGMFGMVTGGNGVDFRRSDGLAERAIDYRAANVSCASRVQDKAKESAIKHYQDKYGPDITVEFSSDSPTVMTSQPGQLTRIPLERFNREFLAEMRKSDQKIDLHNDRGHCELTEKPDEQL